MGITDVEHRVILKNGLTKTHLNNSFLDLSKRP
jgi:hypothetical protein